jgi:putative DNA primase/helicase
MVDNACTTIRLHLRTNGFSPIPTNGKRPSMLGWQEKLATTADEITLWESLYPYDTNTGVLAKLCPGLDIDITHPEAAAAVEALARKHFEEHGNILARTGLPPKVLIPLRTDEPFAKLLRAFTAPNGSTHKIEILSDGQQYVAFGIHPDTKAPYRWHGGDPTTTKREELPYVRRESAERFLDAASRLLVEEFDFVPVAAETTAPGNGDSRQRERANTQWGALKERALANLGAWVPKLFPTAKRTRAGGYRVKSADLGRGREEDLSLTPKGIKYFGDADMGDPRQGRRSPIDVVMEFAHLGFHDAAEWLERALESPQPGGQLVELPQAKDQQEDPQPDEHEAQRQQRQPPMVLPPPTAPMAVARQFVEHCCLHNGAPDALTLRYWHGGWWAWQTTHWVEVEERTVRSLAYVFTERAVFIDDKGKVKPWLPNRYRIGDLLEALSALVILSREFEQPCWLDGRETGPIVATENGLLDIGSEQLYPHTPLYFGQVSVPFAYEPAAPEPTGWKAFLDELWPQETEAIDVLAEWFGYVISGRLDLHKIMMMVGPTRGGKGLIARILAALVGKRNVCGPTLSSLGGEFGLAPLLGKSLAVISDARFVGKNGGVVVERLLSISGEDTLTVNRKYREQWSGKLPVRLHVISNELPHLGDASHAIVGRIVLLPLTRSWLGKENHELESELRGELSGILNWALAGLKRLTFDNDNRFTRLAAAEEAIMTMRDLASPVGAFVREECELGPNQKVEVGKLYDRYKQWCADSEHAKVSKHVFGRDLRAACPSVIKTRPKAGTGRLGVYSGIAPRPREGAADGLL